MNLDNNDIEHQSNKILNDDQLLDIILKAAPYFAHALGDDISLGVLDKEKFIYYREGKKVPLGIKVGDRPTPGGATERAISTGKRLESIVKSEVHGVAYWAVSSPIKNNTGKVIGCISIGISLARQAELLNMSENLAVEMDAVLSNVTNLSATSQQLAATTQELADNGEKINQQAQEMDKVLIFIKEIAEQTHLLGLNAAIEAARAGNHGRTFNVVAGEIRKLAAKTRSSVEEITANLREVQEGVRAASEYITQISSAIQELASASEEIHNSMENLQMVIEQLKKHAGKFSL